MQLGRVTRWGSLAFCCGVLAASILFQFESYFFSALIVFCIISVVLVWQKSNDRKLWVALIFFCFGFWYAQLALEHAVRPISIDGVGVLHGTVTFSSDGQQSQRLRVRVDNPVSHRGKTLALYVSLYPEYEYGDEVKFKCIRKENPKKITFFSEIYTAKSGAIATCFYPSVTLVRHKPSIIENIFSLKKAYASVLNKSLHEPEAVLARAMLIGEQGAIPKELTQAFAAAGITHLIAISGMNITIFVFMVEFMLIRFGVRRAARVAANTLIIGVYIFILGFPASAVRAALMSLAVLYARSLGRPVSMFHVLTLTAAIMIMTNPLIAAFDVGFQLSFCAMIGMLMTYDWWKRLLWFIPETGGMQTIVATTMSAQVFTLPLVIFDFKIVSLLTPIANLLVVPTLPLIMILSLCALPFVAVQPLLDLVVWPLFFIIKWVSIVARAFSSLSWSWITLSPTQANLIALGYCALLCTVLFLQYREKRKKIYVTQH